MCTKRNRSRPASGVLAPAPSQLRLWRGSRGRPPSPALPLPGLDEGSFGSFPFRLPVCPCGTRWHRHVLPAVQRPPVLQVRPIYKSQDRQERGCGFSQRAYSWSLEPGFNSLTMTARAGQSHVLTGELKLQRTKLEKRKKPTQTAKPTRLPATLLQLMGNYLLFVSIQGSNPDRPGRSAWAWAGGQRAGARLRQLCGACPDPLDFSPPLPPLCSPPIRGGAALSCHHPLPNALRREGVISTGHCPRIMGPSCR